MIGFGLPIHHARFRRGTVQKRTAGTTHWDDLLTLAVLARSGSYAACARELGLTHATVIRRLRRLETALGAPVAESMQGRIELSPAGRIALAAAEQMERHAARIGRELEARRASPGSVSGTVRLTATEGVATLFIAERLPALRERHPGLTVDLIVEARRASLARREAHLAIRLNRPVEEQVVARRVGTIHYGVYGNAAMRRRYADEGLAALPFCQLALSLAPGVALPEIRWVDKQIAREAIVLSSNSVDTLLMAAAAGTGAALLPHFAARTQPSLHLLQDCPDVRREVWLAYPSEYRRQPRFRAVADWLAECFAEMP